MGDGACLLVRRTVVQQVGSLDPEIFMFHEDLEWCTRMRAAGWKIFYQPASLVHHLGGGSTRQDLRNMLVISQHSLYYFYEKYFGSVKLRILRLLTMGEMILRHLAWSVVFALQSGKRQESRERMAAYRQILAKSVMDKAYWAPAE